MRKLREAEAAIEVGAPGDEVSARIAAMVSAGSRARVPHRALTTCANALILAHYCPGAGMGSVTAERVAAAGSAMLIDVLWHPWLSWRSRFVRPRFLGRVLESITPDRLDAPPVT